MLVHKLSFALYGLPQLGKVPFSL